MAKGSSLGIIRRTRLYAKRRRKSSAARIAELLDDLQSTSHEELLAREAASLTVEAEPRGVGEIEINDTCNLDCVFCKTSLSKRTKGVMALDIFEQVLERLKAQGIRATTLHTIGDPLSNPRLPRDLELMRKHGIAVEALSSNCLRVDRHIDTIFEYRDVIQSFRPSIDGATRDVYEKIRGG